MTTDISDEAVEAARKAYSLEMKQSGGDPGDGWTDRPAMRAAILAAIKAEARAEAAEKERDEARKEAGLREFERDQQRAAYQQASAQYGKFVELYHAEKDRADTLTAAVRRAVEAMEPLTKNGLWVSLNHVRSFKASHAELSALVQGDGDE